MSLESESYKKSQVHQDLWILDNFPDVTLVCEGAHPAVCLTRPCGGGGCKGTQRPQKRSPETPWSYASTDRFWDMLDIKKRVCLKKQTTFIIFRICFISIFHTFGSF